MAEDADIDQQTDGIFQAADRKLAERFHISLRDASLIRAWWSVRDERKNAEFEGTLIEDEIKGKLELEKFELEIDKYLKASEEWSESSTKRFRKHIQLCFMAAIVEGVLYAYVGRGWAMMWALFCILGVLAQIENHIFCSPQKPKPPK